VQYCTLGKTGIKVSPDWIGGNVFNAQRLGRVSATGHGEGNAVLGGSLYHTWQGQIHAPKKDHVPRAQPG
jgi:hypothetical protein